MGVTSVAEAAAVTGDSQQEGSLIPVSKIETFIAQGLIPQENVHLAPAELVTALAKQKQSQIQVADISVIPIVCAAVVGCVILAFGKGGSGSGPGPYRRSPRE